MEYVICNVITINEKDANSYSLIHEILLLEELRYTDSVFYFSSRLIVETYLI